MANIARLGVLLGLDSAEFSKGIEAAKKKLQEVSTSMVTYSKVGAAALAAMSVKALAFADDISDIAAASDMTIDSIIKLSDALENNGGKADNAGKMLSSFISFVDNAASGSDAAQKSFQKAGISLNDLAKLSTQDLFQKTVDSVAKIEDPLTRSAKAMEIFGKAAKGVEFTGLAEGMNETTKATQAQADAIKQLGDVHDLLAQHARESTLVLAVELGPTLKTTLDYIKSLSSETNTFGQVFNVIFRGIAFAAGTVAFAIKTVVEELKTLGKQAIALMNFDWAKIAQLQREQNKMTAADFAKYTDFSKKMLFGDDEKKESEPTKRTAAIGRTITPSSQTEAIAEARKRLQAEIALLGQKMKIEKDIFDLDMLALKIGDEAVAQGKATLKYIEDIEKIKKDATEERAKKDAQVDLINQKEKDAIKLRTQELGYELTLMQEKQNKKDAAADREIANLREIGELQLELTKLDDPFLMLSDFEKSVMQEKINYQITMKDLVNQLAEAEENADEKKKKRIEDQMNLEQKQHDQRMKNMDAQNKLQQVDVFGKSLATMGQYSRAAFSMWKAFQVSKTIIDTISGARAAFTAFAGIPIIGPALGTAAAAAAVAAGMAQVAMIRSQSFQGRAKGGDVAGGTPYIVGEKGPELIIPGKSGTVVPNHTLMEAVGGKQNTVVNNYTINAIDTKSFDDRLLASANTIWAANLYANKSIASGRGRA